MTNEGRHCLTCGGDLGSAADWARHCPKCAGVPEEPQLRLMSEQGFYLEIADSASPQWFEHSVGGPHDVSGAVCNGHGCNRPFIRLLTLDLRDPRLSFMSGMKREAAGAVASHQMPLFYCWVCGGQPTYRLERTGPVTVIGRSSTGPEKDFPYPEYPAQFPARRAVLSPIPSEIQKIVRESNAGTLDPDLRFDSKYESHLRPRHQVGGSPYFVQGNHECNDCPSCGSLMQVLASASADSGSEKPFIGDPFTQVVFEYCVPCQIVSASHHSD
jgi:hypothetical protein